MQNKVLQKILLNCEDTAALISLAREQRIGAWRKTRLFMHIAICEGCRKYYQFVQRIGVRVRREAEPEKMPEGMRTAILARHGQNTKQNPQSTDKHHR